MPGLVTKIVVNFYTDFTSWWCLWSTHFCYLYVQCWPIPYTCGFCNPV